MEKSKVFLRGQIWFWFDPIYGNKEQNRHVTDGEQTMRYSRYVLIVQDDRTIDNHALLVIPLSSQNHDKNDVPVTISFLSGNKNKCYAKCQCLWPVSMSQMRKYICTLSEEVMKEIDEKIIKLLLPGVAEKLGIRVPADIYDSILKSADSEISDMDTEDLVVEEDIDPEPVDETIPIVKKNLIGKKWTDERIENFVRTYVTEGEDVAREMFGLSKSTVQKYIHTWRKRFTDVIDTWSKVDEPDNPDNIDNTNADYDIDIIHRSLSAFSNAVKDDICIGSCMYLTIYMPNEYKEDRHMDEKTFYTKLGNIIYHSFMQFMEIDKYDDGTLVWVGDDRDSIDMAFFFMKISSAGWFSLGYSAEEIMRLFRRDYGRSGLDEKWGEVLFDKIRTSLNINKEGATQIYQLISDKLIAE